MTLKPSDPTLRLDYYRNQDFFSEPYSIMAKPPIRITPPFFFLMLALSDGALHGHAMSKEVEDRSGGSVKLGPGSLYWSLGRLCDVGLIEETDPPLDETDDRKRFYVLTAYGKEILAQEISTLEKIVEYARFKRIV